MLNIPYNVLLSNAFYLKKSSFLKYDELENYKETLYKTLLKKNKYISFDDSINSRISESIITINGYTFIKLDEGIICNSIVDKEFIDRINSIYDNDNKELINESYNNYNKKKLVLKNN